MSHTKHAHLTSTAAAQGFELKCAHCAAIELIPITDSGLAFDEWGRRMKKFIKLHKGCTYETNHNTELQRNH